MLRVNINDFFLTKSQTIWTFQIKQNYILKHSCLSHFPGHAKFFIIKLDTMILDLPISISKNHKRQGDRRLFCSTDRQETILFNSAIGDHFQNKTSQFANQPVKECLSSGSIWFQKTWRHGIVKYKVENKYFMVLVGLFYGKIGSQSDVRSCLLF